MINQCHLQGDIYQTVGLRKCKGMTMNKFDENYFELIDMVLLFVIAMIKTEIIIDNQTFIK